MSRVLLSPTLREAALRPPADLLAQGRVYARLVRISPGVAVEAPA
ncbi:hypothetical protein [Xanthobacter oligotrophicus]|nr:hypothetical protein [Xanthobacter oligotrophicus]